MTVPTVTNVTYDKTYPAVEHATAVIVETVASFTAAGRIGERTAIVAFGAMEAANTRNVTEQVVRDLTANKTIHYSDNSKTVVTRDGLTSTSTQISPQGNPAHETHLMGSTVVERQFDQKGNPGASTFHVSEAGSFTFDKNGKYTGGKCLIQ